MRSHGKSVVPGFEPALKKLPGQAATTEVRVEIIKRTRHPPVRVTVGVAVMSSKAVKSIDGQFKLLLQRKQSSITLFTFST